MGKIKDNTLLIKIIDIIEFLFKLCFLIYGLASFNSFTAHTKFISFILFTSGLLAIILLLYRIINFRRFIHNKLLWLSMAFMLSYIVSFLLNIEYANTNGIKTLIFMGMQFCLLLATDERKTFKDQKSELKIILTFFNVYMFVSAISSIVLLFCGYSNIVERNGQRILSGIVWGRLWGVFVDPNYGAVLAAMAVIISLYAIAKYKNVLLRIVSIVNICAQIAYIDFSDSRTGLVVLLVALFVYFVCFFISLNIPLKLPLKSIICIALALLVSVSAFYAVNSVNKMYNVVISYKYQTDINGTSSENKIGSDGNSSNNDNSTTIDDTSSVDPNSGKDNTKFIEIGRGEDIEHDISNRRFDLWKSAIETVKIVPLFGVSFENVVDFVKDHFPDTYLINNDHGVFNNYHNVLFNVLVGQGLVGFIILLIMIAYAGISLIKIVYRAFGTEDYLLCAMLFALLVLALASAMFLSDIIYVISVNMMMFWYLLGTILKKSREES